MFNPWFFDDRGDELLVVEEEETYRHSSDGRKSSTPSDSGAFCDHSAETKAKITMKRHVSSVACRDK